MNYADLCTAVQNTLENTFSDEDLARFALLTEERVYQNVQPPALRANQTAAVTAGVPYLTLPPGFLFPYSLAVVQGDGRYAFLLNKDVNYVREVYPFPATTGQPKVYALFDADSLLLGPTPDTSYTVELHYGKYPETISVALDTWISQTVPGVMLNGMLLEGARFMKEEADLLAMHEKAFVASMAELKRLADGKLRQDAYRSGQARAPVN